MSSTVGSADGGRGGTTDTGDREVVGHASASSGRSVFALAGSDHAAAQEVTVRDRQGRRSVDDERGEVDTEL